MVKKIVFILKVKRNIKFLEFQPILSEKFHVIPQDDILLSFFLLSSHIHRS